MSSSDIIRAWKDAEYRASLGAEALALLPAHPAGWIEVADAGLDAVMTRGLRVRTSVRAGYGGSTGACPTEPCPGLE